MLLLHMDQCGNLSVSSVFPSYLLYKLWAECSGMGQHVAGHTPPPGTKIQAQHQN